MSILLHPRLWLFAAFLLLLALAVGFHHPLMLPATLAGICIGSFLNVVVYRLPRMVERAWLRDLRDNVPVEHRATALMLGQQAAQMDCVTEGLDEPFNLSAPRSRCPRCGHAITALENIPVLSFLWLGGRCSGCHSPISYRYPLVELLTGALTFGALAILGFTWQGAAVTVACWFGVALSLIDFDSMTLPDELSYALLWTGLLFSIPQATVGPAQAIYGAVMGYGVLFGLNGLYKIVRGEDGIGQGDFKLAAALGAFVGPEGLPLVFLASWFSAGMAGIALACRQGRPVATYRIPFGPFLVAAALVLLLAPEFRQEWGVLWQMIVALYF